MTETKGLDTWVGFSSREHANWDKFHPRFFGGGGELCHEVYKAISVAQQ